MAATGELDVGDDGGVIRRPHPVGRLVEGEDVGLPFGPAERSPPATKEELMRVIEQRLMNEDLGDVSWPRVLKAAAKLSFAEAVRCADDALKERLIEQKDRITTELLLSAISDRTKAARPGVRPKK